MQLCSPAKQDIHIYIYIYTYPCILKCIQSIQGYTRLISQAFNILGIEHVHTSPTSRFLLDILFPWKLKILDICLRFLNAWQQQHQSCSSNPVARRLEIQTCRHHEFTSILQHVHKGSKHTQTKHEQKVWFLGSTGHIDHTCESLCISAGIVIGYCTLGK